MPTSGISPKHESSKIQVFCRIRPKLHREKNKPSDSVAVYAHKTNKKVLEVHHNGAGGIKSHNAMNTYVLDHVFPPSSKQEDVYKQLKPILAECFQGINCTVYCYGQTGTGKTHTMLGIDMWGIAAAELLTSNYYKTSNTHSRTKPRKFDNRSRWGVIPNTAATVFSTLQEMGGKKEICEYTVSCTYLELYNERIYDLLSADTKASDPIAKDYNSLKDDDQSPRHRKKGLNIREDKVRGVYVPGASDIVVDNEEQILSLLWEGARNRAVSATDMNEYSSRSHTIFQIIIEMVVNADGNDGPKFVRRSKINLVDLAGSETMKENKIASLNQKRINELTSINQSLSCLGNCVRALSQSKRSHVPYRDSKLTRLLQDSLGGNTKTTFVVTISPSNLALSETISTLQFADRAKQVKVHVVANESLVAADALKAAELEIKRLRGLLSAQSRIEKGQALKHKIQQAIDDVDKGKESGSGNDEIAELKATIKKLQMQINVYHKDQIIRRFKNDSIEPVVSKVRLHLRNKSDRSINSKNHEWLSLYTRWLKTLPTIDKNFGSRGKKIPTKQTTKIQETNVKDSIDHTKLSVNERLALMEWSTLLQMEELEKAKESFLHEAEQMAKQIAILKLKGFRKPKQISTHISHIDSTSPKNAIAGLEGNGDAQNELMQNSRDEIWHRMEDVKVTESQQVSIEDDYSCSSSNTSNYENHSEDSINHIENTSGGDPIEETYDIYGNENENLYEYGVRNVDTHKFEKDTLSVSQELDAFFSEILTPSAEKQDNEGISAQKVELTVNIENSTDEFIREEVLSPSRVWHKVFDNNSGQYYYFNEKTKATQWHEPKSPSVEIRSMSPYEE